ncbi:hypothetical protein PYCCODRAFT_1476708 [Trametes coccinea BRFM310]|uniref:Uncharacterized protein n=1 Tax=Trametes coccinea (strain BRFM310) TaxID=1353009 RepID=A0A1Y2IU82_TRAC3|nr:hypothetical protein PYCCODRAFT_1476708 [Trametes coccinea BRFM310]
MSSSAAQAGPSHRASMPTPPRESTYARAGYSDEESGSELDSSGSDEEFESATQGYKSPSPAAGVKGKAPASPSRTSKHQASAKRAGSWADLDLSIIVALVSPIGNWLTGGDHIKNLFLIILLIFYLHQIVEIPWQLYLSSRPRKHTRRTVASKHHRDEDAAARLAALAENELRRHELFYLGLAIASPFIGAAFLRYVLSALGDNQALSWFSTTLFVLATGIRPWTHLINRLNERTEELHDALHTPDEESLAHIQEETQRALDAALKRIDALEREMQDLREGVKRSEQLREVCDDLSEILGDVERATKRNERKTDNMRSAMGARLSTVEFGLVQLEERRRKDIAAIEAAGFRLPEKSVLFKQARAYFWSFVDKVMYLPRALLLLGMDEPRVYNAPPTPPSEPNGNGNGAAVHVTGILLNRVRSPEKHLAHLAPRLETIPEAEDSDSEGTFVSEKDGNGGRKSARSRSRSRSGSSITRPRVPKPTSYGQRAFEYAQGAVLWPYRASVRVLVAVLPPVARVMPKV